MNTGIGVITWQDSNRIAFALLGLEFAQKLVLQQILNSDPSIVGVDDSGSSMELTEVPATRPIEQRVPFAARVDCVDSWPHALRCVVPLHRYSRHVRRTHQRLSDLIDAVICLLLSEPTSDLFIIPIAHTDMQPGAIIKRAVLFVHASAVPLWVEGLAYEVLERVSHGTMLASQK